MESLPPAQVANMAREDQGPAARAIVIAFTILSFICVCLRFFTRIRFQKNNVGWEDYSIALSMSCSIAMAVCQIYQVHWGSGKHMSVLDVVAVVHILKYLYFSILAYCVSLTLTKISILLQYRRIFTLRTTRLPIYVVFGICIAFGIESVITGIFTCIPVDAFWNVMKTPTARCLDKNALYYANASLNIVTDLLVAVLPVKAVWSLQIQKMQKIALLVILTIGWFVCIVSILRLHALVVLARHPEDSTWYSTATAYWSAIEVNLAIVCASTPALKPLIVKLIPAFSTRTGNWGYGSHRSARQNESGKFVELDNELSHSTGGVVLKSDNASTMDTMPGVSHDQGIKAIYVQHDFERHSRVERKDSESESERHLVDITIRH